MCRSSAGAQIETLIGVAVIDDAFLRIDKVARCLHLYGRICWVVFRIIVKLFVGDCPFVLVGSGKSYLDIGVFLGNTVLVLCIDISSAFAGRYIYQVKLYDTRYGTVNFFTCGFSLLIKNFKPYARCKGYFVLAGTVVAFTVIEVGIFPVVVGC
ncbi:MAG: hypothetical protein BWY95_00939 [Bacteroidetes bacterium ADurb.BinA104]|nr:MAG: hypothetical protein BWY95_00939 [Bacteroidetes bacterium ADurb.BinA104]